MVFSVPGTTDFSGSFDFYGLSPLGVIVPGTTYVFYGQESSNQEYFGGIIIDSVSMSCDISNGGLISGTANFSSIGSSTATFGANNNALSVQAATSLTNTAVPWAYSARAGKVAWNPIIAGSLNGYADVNNATSWSLTLSANNPSFRSKNTGGVTKRISGPLTGASIQVAFMEGDFSVLETNATLYRPGTVGGIRLYLDADDYFQLHYASIDGLSTDADVENGSPISQNMDLSFTGFAYISGTNTRGSIATVGTDVGAVTYWN